MHQLPKSFLLPALLVLALAVRLYQIDSLSNDFHAIRQYHSALMIRPEFLKTQPEAPSWRLEIAYLNQPQVLEPPIIQLAALVGYALVGSDQLWIPRTIAAIAWVIGGYFVYRMGKRLYREEAALVAVTFYLFVPFGIEASRSFQANPIMISLLVASLFTIIRYFDCPNRTTLFWAVLTSMLAIFVLALAAFIIYSLFAWLALRKYSWRRAITHPHVWVFGIVSLLPTIIYYGLGLYVLGFLAGQMGALFLPQLWLSAEYWVNWVFKVVEVVGFVPLVLSLQALLTTRDPKLAAVIRSLWSAYLLFGLLVTYPIYTHNYYSLPLIPIAGLSLGCVAERLLSWLPKRHLRLSMTLTGVAISAIIILSLGQYLPTTIVTEKQGRSVEAARQIGEQLGHSAHIIALTDDYGSELRYYGEIAGTNWPSYNSLKFLTISGQPELSIDDRLGEILSQGRYDYFVITSSLELQLQTKLADYLQNHFPVLTQTRDYLIYDLRNQKSSVPG